MQQTLGIIGSLKLELQCDHPDRVRISTTKHGRATFDRKRDLWVIEEPNGLVNTGLNLALDRLFGLSGPPAAISHIGVSSNTTAVTPSTVYLNGGSGGAAANTIIKALSPAATRASQVITAGATFVPADFTSGVFAIAKIGLLNTATDAGTGLLDVIGGTGGADPYSRTFAVDFSAGGTFTLVPQILITAVGVKASFPSPL